MQHSTQVKWLVNGLARQHNLDLVREGQQLYLRRGSKGLLIEVLRPNEIRIATHVITSNRLLTESDVVFFVSGGRWYPIREADTFDNYRYFAILVEDENGEMNPRFNQPGQLDLARFCDSWGLDLRAVVWPNHNEQFPASTFSELPVVRSLDKYSPVV